MDAINLENKIMSDIKTIHSARDLEIIFQEMTEVYGPQSHIPKEVLLELAKTFPELFVRVTKKDESLGHLIILPFNADGVTKITDDESFEEDIKLDDFQLNFSKDQSIHFFIYSIYGKSNFSKAKLIKQVQKAVSKYANIFDENNSQIFAEVVSIHGERISTRLGLSHYMTYTFDDEELHLYKTNFLKFLKTCHHEISL